MSKNAALLIASVGLFLACGSPSTSDAGTGGGTATGGGSATGGGTGTGGGSASGGDGGPCTQQINVTIAQNCNSLPSPGACGGALDGRYCYTGFCIDESTLLADLRFQCAAVGGTVTLSNTVGTLSGMLEFDAGRVTRTGSLQITGTAFIPPLCVVPSCASLELGLTGAGNPATCTPSGGGCSCTYSSPSPVWDAVRFSRDGGVVTVAGRTYEYCVQGDGLAYFETTFKPGDPGVATLSR